MFAAKRAAVPRLLASTPLLTDTPRVRAEESTRDEGIGGGARGASETTHLTIEVAGNLVRRVHEIGLKLATSPRPAESEAGAALDQARGLLNSLVVELQRQVFIETCQLEDGNPTRDRVVHARRALSNAEQDLATAWADSFDPPGGDPGRRDALAHAVRLVRGALRELSDPEGRTIGSTPDAANAPAPKPATGVRTRSRDDR